MFKAIFALVAFIFIGGFIFFAMTDVPVQKEKRTLTIEIEDASNNATSS